MTITMTAKKEDLACVLRTLADAIEKAEKVDNFHYNVAHETIEIPAELWMTEQLTGWINVDFNIRFLKS